MTKLIAIHIYLVNSALYHTGSCNIQATYSFHPWSPLWQQWRVTGTKVLLGRISLQVEWPEAVISQTVYEVVGGKVSSSFAQPQPGGPLYATPTSLSYCERGTRAVFLDHTKLVTHTHTHLR